MQFGSLDSVPLRDAWANEAQNFTPWLAENLESLSDVIGIRMELEDSEVNVEEFSADILARNPTNGSHVLIENQLENSDHKHLGQILTYLAGLESQTVIWIAQDFAPAHLSAVRWLNEHTDDPFAFFAVQVKVVRIGDSPLAPVFEVRELPSQWDRRIRSISTETLSELAQFRRNFWAFYSERFPGEVELSPGYRAVYLSHGVEGSGIRISQYLYPSKRHVGMYIVGPRGESDDAVVRQLEPFESRFKEEFGVPEFRATLDAGSNHFAGIQMQEDPLDRDNWPAIADWFHDRLAAYRRILTVAER